MAQTDLSGAFGNERPPTKEPNISETDGDLIDAGEDEGGMVTVVWGEQVLTPKPYNTFHFGPFSMTTQVHEGESVEDAIERAYTHLDRMARRLYPLAKQAFYNALGL